MSFRNRVVVVTGGSAGIGRATVRAFARALQLRTATSHVAAMAAGVAGIVGVAAILKRLGDAGCAVKRPRGFPYNSG